MHEYPDARIPVLTDPVLLEHLDSFARAARAKD
jgi:hypothetical protein